MASFVLTVETVAGTSEETAASDLMMLARQLGIVVETSFQDVVMRASPSDHDWRHVLEQWQRECRLADYPQD